MGQRMKRCRPTTMKPQVRQGEAVGRIHRLAPLPHHPTPKGVVVWWGGGDSSRCRLRGGAEIGPHLSPLEVQHSNAKA